MPHRPTLVAGPERAHLLWTAQTDAGWPVFHAPVDSRGVGEPERLTDGDRPPIDVTGCRTADGIAVAWESAGSRSEIRGATWTDGSWSAPRTLSADCDAAYDAAIAPAAAADPADRYLLYTALRDGWYEVAGRRLVDGTWTDPQVLSRQPGLAAYPTVVGAGGTPEVSGGPADTAAPAGPPGAWVAWVVHRPGGAGDIRPFVDHRRREDQHAPFRGERAIHAFHWDGDSVRAPVYDRGREGVGEGNDHSGIVVPASEGTRPALLGGDALRIAWLDHRSDPDDDYDDGQQNRPRVGVSRFDGDGWTAARNGPVYGDAGRLHHTLVDGGGEPPTPRIASGHDSRPMGGWSRFETEDHEGGCGVGVLDAATTDGTAVEPTLRRQNRWVHRRRDARNPPVDAKSADGRDLLFLNLHRHTDLSVCNRASDGEPAFNVRLALDLLREDAVCFTDHCYNSDPVARFRTDRAMRTYAHAGIVTLPAYEWTGTHRTQTGEHYGHFNVHWFEDGVPPLGSPNAGIEPYEPDGLATALDDHDALAVPHHTANKSHYLRPDLFGFPHAPVVEIFQAVRGTCEERDGPGATEVSDIDDDRCFVRSALDAGHRLGFVGGGDHSGIALTGVWVDEVSRSGLYDALRERRCFATTGTTLAVDARVGDTRMGGRHEPPAGAESVTYELDATVPDGVDTIQILRDGEVVDRLGGGERIEATVDVGRDPATEHDIYTRLLLANGEVAWASPIWLLPDD